MDAIWQDLRYTVRQLRQDPAFAVVIILTLAVGIGANTAVFSLVHSTLLKPLPYSTPDRLAMIWTDIPAQGVREARSALANIEDWQAQNRVFEDLATYDPTSLTLTDGDWPEQVSTVLASANLFPVLGVTPALGRAFSLEEETRRVPVVVLSHDLWQRRFNGSRAAIGRTVEIRDTVFEVVGVMPEAFGFPDRNTQLWLPRTLFTDWDDARVRRGTDAWRVIGRLRTGVSVDEARTDMGAIAARLERAYPDDNAGLGINVVPLYEQVTGQSFRLAAWMLFGAVGIVLLMACANAAYLILTRGIDRGQEFALRQALGATTPRLVRQALTESLALSVAAGVAGLLLAVGLLRVLITVAPADLPRLHEIGINGWVLTYAVAVSLAAGVLFGTAPALRFSRGGLFGLLRSTGAGTRTAGHHARSLLIAFQFALAIILMFGANLLIRSLLAARSVDPGFTTDRVIMANLSVAPTAGGTTFYDRVLAEVQAIPGVGAAGLIEDLFISGAPNGELVIEGRADETGFAEIRSDAIAGDFFRAAGVTVLEGRGFVASDGAEATPVAIINETMARRYWPGASPVGRRFRQGAADADAPWIEVVGMVGDMHRQGLETEPIAQVFRPMAQQPSRSMNLLVQSQATVEELAIVIRARIAGIDPTVPLYRVTTVDRTLDGYLQQRRFQTFLLSLFSTVALLLAAVGIYGLIQNAVARRTHELGVRIALGARPVGLVGLLLRQGFSLALAGLVAGIVCALWLSEVVASLLFGVAATDPTSVVVTATILMLTALVACYIPARRATRVDPLTALKSR